MVKAAFAAAVFAAAFSFLEGCNMQAALFGFGTEKQKFTQSREVFGNALMGYAPSAKEQKIPDDVTLLYVAVTWKELEPERGVYDWAAIETKNQFARWRSEGKHLILRFVCDNPGKESHADIPEWLYEATGKDGDWYDNDYGKGYAPDYANETMIREHAKAVKAMGERWGSDAFISYMELGSIGHWGEWHVNYGAGVRRLPPEHVLEQYVSGWQEAFPQAMILMRRPFKAAKDRGFGIYNDMAGHPHDTETWLDWIQNGGIYDQTGETDAIVPMPDFWKTAPVGGELNSSLSMRQMLAENLAQTAELIRSSHTTFLGPKTADPSYPDGYRTLLKNMGYRIWISEARLKKASGKTSLSLTWKNDGTAPFYKDWPVVVMVMDASGTVIEERQTDWNLSELMPGTEMTVSVDLSSAGLLKRKTSGLTVAVEIRDPMTKKAAVRLANQELDRSKNKTRMVLFAR